MPCGALQQAGAYLRLPALVDQGGGCSLELAGPCVAGFLSGLSTG